MKVRRALLLVATVAAVASVGLLARLGFPDPVPGDQVFSGLYVSDTDIQVTNLTIDGGRVDAGYSVDVLLMPREHDAGIRCRLVDTTGRLEFFDASSMVVKPGRWASLTFEAAYELPELTLGLRCASQTSGPLTVLFRNAQIYAESASG